MDNTPNNIPPPPPPLIPPPPPSYAPLDLGPPPIPTSARRGNPNLALGLGIASLFTWILPLIGIPVSIAALVFSWKNRNLGGKVTVAMVLSIIGMVLTAINFGIGFYMGFTGQH